MSAYRPYPKYKPSGVEWLGEVPEGWRTVPVFAHFRRVKETNHPDLQLLSVYRDYGVIPKASRDDNFNKASEDLNAYQRIQQGDLVLNKMKAWQGSIGVSSHEGIVSPAYFTYRPSKSSTAFDPSYLHHLVRSLEYIAFYLSRSKGIRVNQWDLDPDEFRSTPMICPPLPEQIKIATFLDRECGKLDALQAKQERLIELLKEKRQALISHAVTRGLDPTAKLKPSGIEWLGDVPEHWKRAKLSHYIETRKGVAFKADDFTDQGTPVVKASDIKNGTLNPSGTNLPSTYPAIYPKAVLKSGNIVLSTVGSIPEVKNSAVGQICEVPASHDGFLLNQNTVIFTTNLVKLDQRFCFMLLKCDRYRDHLDLHAHGTANQASLNVDDMLDFNFPLPPLAEQRAIVAHLDEKCGKIDQLKAKAERGIELLKERRSALISAAVTGKIDVRHL